MKTLEYFQASSFARTPRLAVKRERFRAFFDPQAEDNRRAYYLHPERAGFS
jgi:hypothetical protein